MSPSFRIIAATAIVVLAASYFQLVGTPRAAIQIHEAHPYSELISETRNGVASSSSPELYSPDRVYGFDAVGKGVEQVFTPTFLALKYALDPVRLRQDPQAERLVLYCASPEDAAAYEKSHKVQLLDAPCTRLRIYQRVRE